MQIDWQEFWTKKAQIRLGIQTQPALMETRLFTFCTTTAVRSNMFEKLAHNKMFGILFHHIELINWTFKR